MSISNKLKFDIVFDNHIYPIIIDGIKIGNIWCNFYSENLYESFINFDICIFNNQDIIDSRMIPRMGSSIRKHSVTTKRNAVLLINNYIKEFFKKLDDFFGDDYQIIESLNKDDYFMVYRNCDIDYCFKKEKDELNKKIKNLELELQKNKEQLEKLYKNFVINS